MTRHKSSVASCVNCRVELNLFHLLLVCNRRPETVVAVDVFSRLFVQESRHCLNSFHKSLIDVKRMFIFICMATSYGIPLWILVLASQSVCSLVSCMCSCHSLGKACEIHVWAKLITAPGGAAEAPPATHHSRESALLRNEAVPKNSR